MNQLNPSSHCDHDPFSESSLNTVEAVEALPLSAAFEHLLYDSRIDRTTSYFYTRQSDDDRSDKDPIILEPPLMIGFFPDSLRKIFPGFSYTIEELEAQQIDTKDARTLTIQFLANGIFHSIISSADQATYSTYNEANEPVAYKVAPEAATGLLASFVCSRQYDPLTGRLDLELAEPLIYGKRDHQAALIEQILMTLGDHSGQSITETRAVFDTLGGVPLIATLRDEEFPNRSKTNTNLSLNELVEAQELITSIETVVKQNLVNIEEGNIYIKPGLLENRYAEQSFATLNPLSLTTKEYIDPAAHYPRWVRVCRAFLGVIEGPLKPYSHLDQSDILDQHGFDTPDPGAR